MTELFGPLSRRELEELQTYVPGTPVEEVQERYGLPEIIKMASNENPWGPSPMALQAVSEELSRLAQYPEGSCRALRQALAERFGLHADMITLSNGADNILMMIAQAFVGNGEEVVMAAPTFAVYRTAVILMGGVPIEIPLRDFVHDLEAMARAVGPRTKAVFVCNPNNPTGTIVGREALEEFIDGLPADLLVVLDEVYGDFAAADEFPDGLRFIDRGKALITVRSFSKLYGLAGLRIGYAVAHPELIAALNKVREPFPVNRLAQAAAQGALADEEFRNHVLRETERGRAYLSRALQAMGLTCLPSHTNFLFVDLATDAQAAYEALLKEGIIVRPGGIWGTTTWCRITIGTMEQNERLVGALEKVIKGVRYKA
jgi:histidinol-phosphate aminotransferase